MLNKLDLVDADAAARLRAALVRLNPVARIVEAEHSAAWTSNRCSAPACSTSSAPSRRRAGSRSSTATMCPETEEYGVSSTVFRSELPFHPGRLWDFVTEDLDSGAYGRILRSKGFFTLASRPHVTGLWSQAGSVARFEPSAARDAEAPYAQELVFIGTQLERSGCTRPSPPVSRPRARAVRLADPFPAWETYGVDDTCDHEPAKRRSRGRAVEPRADAAQPRLGRCFVGPAGQCAAGLGEGVLVVGEQRPGGRGIGGDGVTEAVVLLGVLDPHRQPSGGVQLQALVAEPLQVPGVLGGAPVAAPAPSSRLNCWLAYPR